MIVTTNLGFVTDKGVSKVQSNKEFLDCMGRGDKISKKLGGKFLHEGLPMIMNSVFSELSQFHTIHLTFEHR